MTETARLALPLIAEAQAQKHITHNEALLKLDALVQMAVLDRDLTAPPADPAEGQAWIVAAGATGDWAGHDGEVAVWQGGVWRYHQPQAGWVVWVDDEGMLLLRLADGWTVLGDGMWAPLSGAAFSGDISAPGMMIADDVAWRRIDSAAAGSALELAGTDGSLTLAANDGSGRGALRWNVSPGANPVRLEEDWALEWDMEGGPADQQTLGFSVRWAPRAAAGEAITWQTLFSVGYFGAVFSVPLSGDGSGLTGVDAATIGGRPVADLDISEPFPPGGNKAVWHPTVREEDLARAALPIVMDGRQALLVFCTGQSNAVGSNDDARGTSEVNSNVLVWNKLDGTWQVAVPGQYPLDGGGAYDTPNNFAHAFCCRLQKETGLPVYLVLYAYGSHSIVDWSGNTDDAAYDWDIGAAAIYQTTRAIAALPQGTGITAPDVILWSQGEDDHTRDPAWYAGQFSAWLDRLVSGGLYQPGRTPYICVEMADDGLYPGMNAFYRHPALYGVGGIHVATTRGLPLDSGSNVHYSGESLWQLGYYRCWDVYLRAVMELRGAAGGGDADTVDGRHADEFALLSGATFAGGISAPSIGVQTAADMTNRLAVKSDAVLFSHDDVSGAGSGDVRFTVNKAAAGNTSSLLFQTGWSGRAEVGVGSDDLLRLRASADGGAWMDGLALDPAAGIVRLEAPARLQSYTLGALPDPAVCGGGALIHVVDAAGQSGGIAWSDGAAWRRMIDNQIVS